MLFIFWENCAKRGTTPFCTVPKPHCVVDGDNTKLTALGRSKKANPFMINIPHSTKIRIVFGCEASFLDKFDIDNVQHIRALSGKYNTKLQKSPKQLLCTKPSAMPLEISSTVLLKRISTSQKYARQQDLGRASHAILSIMTFAAMEPCLESAHGTSVHASMFPSVRRMLT